MSVITRKNEGETLQILGTQTRFLCLPKQTNQKWSLLEVSLPKGAGAPPHQHPWDEAYYVVTGTVSFVIEGVPHILSDGDFLYAPANTVHAFEGFSDQISKLIVFDAPAHAETFFREIDREVKVMPVDLEKMLAIGESHQVKFALGPD